MSFIPSFFNASDIVRVSLNLKCIFLDTTPTAAEFGLLVVYSFPLFKGCGVVDNYNNEKTIATNKITLFSNY